MSDGATVDGTAINPCSVFITDESLLHATSAYGGFKLCPDLEPNYIHNFLVACVDYYSDLNKLTTLDDTILGNIEEEEQNLRVQNKRKTDINERCLIMDKYNILNNSVKRYEMVQEFKGMKKAYIQKEIATIFTSWVKFILPIPDTDNFLQQTANVLVQLMDSKFSKMISENKDSVYDKLGFSNKSNTRNLKKMSNPLIHIVFNMVFYLCTPNDAILFNLNLLQQYRIFKNTEIFKGDLQDQHNILAIVEELNLKDLESQFSNVYRIPIDTLQHKITVPEKDDDLTNVLAGIECIAAIMSTELKKTTNLTDTDKFRTRLAKTDSSRAAFLFKPTEFMFNGGEFRKPMEFYTFWDILCGQYFQEYKTGIDIEHIITSSRLQYMADFGVTFENPSEDPSKERDFFNFFLSIFSFALFSRFVQICVTNTCNRSAGDKVRWKKTVEDYKNLLTFVCTLYWAVEKNKMDDCEININKKTVREYITQMYTNSDIIHNKELGRKEEFLQFPTMIVPFKFLYSGTVYSGMDRVKNIKDDKKNPLRRNYEFVRNIGMYMNNVKDTGESVSDFIKKIFTEQEQVVQQGRINYYLLKGDEIGLKIPEETGARPQRRSFGKTPQSNIIEMFKGLPSIATMERRIQRMNDLLLGIPYQKPLVQRLLEFETNSDPNLLQTEQKKRTIVEKPILKESPTSPKKQSLFSKLFSNNKRITPQ